MKDLIQKYKGKSFAEAAKAIEKKYPNRNFDPLQKRAYQESMQRLISHQESVKTAESLKNTMRLLKNRGGKNIAQAMQQQMGRMQMPQQPMMQQPMTQQSNMSMPQQEAQMGEKMQYAQGGMAGDPPSGWYPFYYLNNLLQNPKFVSQLNKTPGTTYGKYSQSPLGKSFDTSGMSSALNTATPTTPVNKFNINRVANRTVENVRNNPELSDLFKRSAATRNMPVSEKGQELTLTDLNGITETEPQEFPPFNNRRDFRREYRKGFGKQRIKNTVNEVGDTAKRLYDKTKDALKEGYAKTKDFIQNDADAPMAIGKGIDILGNAIMLAKGYDKVLPQQNKYEDEVRRIMQDRSVDSTAQRNAILSARNAALANSSNYARSKNVQAAMNQNVEANTGSQMSQSLLQQDQMNEGFRGQLASTLNQLGQQRAQANAYAEDATARNKGVFQTNLSNFLSDIGDTGIDLSTRRYSNMMNKTLAELISNKYADFNISKEVAEAISSGRIPPDQILQLIVLSAAKNNNNNTTTQQGTENGSN